MKKWLYLAAALTAVGILSRLPHPAKDIAKLKPVRAVYLYMELEKLHIETDTGDSGSGTTLAEAYSDMRSGADGEIFLDTAEFLILDPAICVTEDFFDRRFRQLRHWEEYLYENGLRMVKIFLNVSRDEQRRRFLDRLELEEKHWKLSTSDMKERALWKEYDAAYEDAVNHTATEESPWYVLPADDKWYTRYLMSEILLDVLTDMAPESPPLDPAEAAKVPAAMAELEKPLE